MLFILVWSRCHTYIIMVSKLSGKIKSRQLSQLDNAPQNQTIMDFATRFILLEHNVQSLYGRSLNLEYFKAHSVAGLPGISG